MTRDVHNADPISTGILVDLVTRPEEPEEHKHVDRTAQKVKRSTMLKMIEHDH